MVDRGNGRAGSVLLWTVGASGPPLALGQHTDEVNAVLFSADGRAVISVGADGYVKMFETSGAERFVSNLGVALRSVCECACVGCGRDGAASAETVAC